MTHMIDKVWELNMKRQPGAIVTQGEGIERIAAITSPYFYFKVRCKGANIKQAIEGVVER